VASICTSDVKAKELDSPLAWGAGVVGGSVPTAGAAAAECVIGGREEAAQEQHRASIGSAGCRWTIANTCVSSPIHMCIITVRAAILINHPSRVTWHMSDQYFISDDSIIRSLVVHCCLSPTRVCSCDTI
jgi:hypothetical protein